MIAEDDAGLRFALRTLLDTEPGFLVVAEAADGIEAVEYIEGVCGNNTRCPDVMILDLNMPELSGYGVIEQLRSGCPGVRILVYSGEDAEAATKKLHELGSYEFVQKGDPEILLERLRSLRKED